MAYDQEPESTSYSATAGTIPTATVNQAVPLTGLGWVSFISVANDNATAGEDITVRLGSTTNPAITIRAGQGFEEGDLRVYGPIPTVYLSNSSGVTVSYRVYATGAA